MKFRVKGISRATGLKEYYMVEAASPKQALVKASAFAISPMMDNPGRIKQKASF